MEGQAAVDAVVKGGELGVLEPALPPEALDGGAVPGISQGNGWWDELLTHGRGAGVLTYLRTYL